MSLIRLLPSAMLNYMIRAVLFDFYGVWTPDIFSEYLAEAKTHGWDVEEELRKAIHEYFRGQIGPVDIAEAFRYNLRRPDISNEQFILSEDAVYPAIIALMRGLHSHFLKVGVLANLGTQEYQLLSNFNTRNQVFEVIGGPYAFQMDMPLLSREVFARALQAIGEPPASTLVVSGNQDYLNYAHSFGITTLPYEGYTKLLPTLERVLSEAA